LFLKKIKKLVPRSVKLAAQAALCEYRFQRALQALLRLPAGETPPIALIEELAVAWGNEGFAAKGDYLLEICRQAARTSGPILECGSGLSTILLGVLAGRRGVSVWALEHIPEWAARSQKVLKSHQLHNVNLCLTPLQDYGEFTWYNKPSGLPERFSLVVCDGPPLSVRGHRYGLMPVLGERLAEGGVILMDDTTLTEEQEVMQRWVQEFRVSVEMRYSPGRSFAILTCPTIPPPGT
jgi:hypothetical protein